MEEGQVKLRARREEVVGEDKDDKRGEREVLDRTDGLEETKAETDSNEPERNQAQ